MRRTFPGQLGVALIATAVLAVGVGVVAARGDDEPQPVDFTHNVRDAPAPVPGTTFGSGPPVKTGTAICTTPAQTGNANTDCETTSTGPHNETSIAINPTNTQNIIGGANDYQLGLNPGGHVSETVLSRAHVSFDGGTTWSMYPVFSNSSYQGTGDPAVAFDAAGHAYYGTLGFRFVGPANATNPDVLVSNSGDGGRTWKVVRVAAGSGTGRVSAISWTRSTSLHGATAMPSSPTATSAMSRRGRSSRPRSTAPSLTTAGEPGARRRSSREHLMKRSSRPLSSRRTGTSTSRS